MTLIAGHDKVRTGSAADRTLATTQRTTHRDHSARFFEMRIISRESRTQFAGLDGTQHGDLIEANLGQVAIRFLRVGRNGRNDDFATVFLTEGCDRREQHVRHRAASKLWGDLNVRDDENHGVRDRSKSSQISDHCADDAPVIGRNDDSALATINMKRHRRRGFVGARFAPQHLLGERFRSVVSRSRRAHRPQCDQFSSVRNGCVAHDDMCSVIHSFASGPTLGVSARAKDYAHRWRTGTGPVHTVGRRILVGGSFMFVGFGTFVNVFAIVIGASLGMLVGHRLDHRVKTTVTTGLGLVTLLIAAQSTFAITDPVLSTAVGHQAPTLIVLGALLIGGIIGSTMKLDDRVHQGGDWLRSLVTQRSSEPTERQRFIDGFVTSSLVFCVGPLTILGSLNEGLGLGPDQLIIKAALDGFAALAFAASFGIGVMASALAVLVIQGSLTILGLTLGNFMPEAHLMALTATGGLILVGLAFKLLQIGQIRVVELLPALIMAPLLVEVVTRTR